LSQTSRHDEIICVSDFHDLCPLFPRGKVSAKVGLMEFGLFSRYEGGSMPPPQEPYSRVRPSATIFGHPGLKLSFPAPISGYAYAVQLF